MTPQPNNLDGIPVCSRYNCECFYSSVQPGWGVKNGCYKWTESMGKEYDFGLMKPTLCKPKVEEVLNAKRTN